MAGSWNIRRRNESANCHLWPGEYLVNSTGSKGIVPYSKKLWRGKNFGEFGESQQFANFFSPIFILVHLQ